MELGNQQERIAFVAGLIEGEGTITISVLHNKSSRNGIRIRPMIVINNTSKELIDFTMDLLHSLDCAAYVYWRMQKSSPAKIAAIQIIGYWRIKRFLDLILPWLISKKQQAQLVLSLCNRRCYVKSNEPYEDADFELAEKIKELNLKPKERMRRLSSTSIRPTL